MRITKHEHATLRIEHEGATLILDPGAFTPALPDLASVTAVVITHNHPDHWSTEHLDAIRAASPDAAIYSTAQVAEAHGDSVTVVSAGDIVESGPFRLEFFPSTHEEIHSSIAVPENLAVLVNDTILDPGDSYASPQGRDISILAVPAGAPWLRIGDAMDYVLHVAPKQVIYIHDAPLSPIGLNMHKQRLAWAAEQVGAEFTPLDPGGSISIDPAR